MDYGDYFKKLVSSLLHGWIYLCISLSIGGFEKLSICLVGVLTSQKLISVPKDCVFIVRLLFVEILNLSSDVVKLSYFSSKIKSKKLYNCVERVLKFIQTQFELF